MLKNVISVSTNISNINPSEMTETRLFVLINNLNFSESFHVNYRKTYD